MTRRILPPPGLSRNRRLAVAALVLALLLAGAAGLSRLGYQPNTGPDVFDSKAEFDAFVAGLRLESLALDQAGETLVRRGFRCDLLDPGNLSCHRRVRGSNCGEQQFVDLLTGTAGGAPLRVSTRFGLTCN